jgi:hypothetical protein
VTSNSIGKFTSPVYPRSSSTCKLKFWFTFNTDGYYGSFLNASIYSNNKQIADLFRFQGFSRTTNWTYVDINIGSIYSPFQIVFQAAKSITRRGEITIDNISFEDCALPYANVTTCNFNNETRCLRGNCVSNDRVCDFVDDCGDFTDETLPICNSYTK